MITNILKELKNTDKKQKEYYDMSAEYLTKGTNLTKYIFILCTLMFLTSGILKMLIIICWSFAIGFMLFYYNKAKEYEKKGDDCAHFAELFEKFDIKSLEDED